MIIDLRLGDCAEILKTIPDKSVDLVVTDPPYKMETSGGGIIKKREYMAHLEDSGIVDSYDLVGVGRELLRVLKKPNLYFFCNKLQIYDYFNFYVGECGCSYEILRWEKINPIPAFNSHYMADTEYCLFFYGKGMSASPQCYEDAFTFYQSFTNKQDKSLFSHPTCKPVEFVARMVRNSSKLGDTVLDPFMGSGATGVACRDEGRSFIGIEINPKWHKVAGDRINERHFKSEIEGQIDIFSIDN